MSRETLSRLVRRAIVLGATVAVIAVAAGTVKVAADWRAASAPLDVAPVGMESVNLQLVSETDRAGALSEQIGSVAGDIATLQGALLEANQHIAGDAQGAETLKKDLAAAKKKLDALQAQLMAAQDRLAALNRAAARQAAANAASKSTGTTSGGGGEPDDD